LAGGGRYDDLIKKLGYTDLPAVGFAIGDVTLGNLLKEKKLVPELSRRVHCFVVYSEQTEGLAMRQAVILREKNINVDYCLRLLNFSKQLKAASQAGAQYVIIFGEEEVKSGCVKLKDMLSGHEKLVKIDKLTEVIF
jgi:histidyl-tRNA synthetase